MRAFRSIIFATLLGTALASVESATAQSGSQTPANALTFINQVLTTTGIRVLTERGWEIYSAGQATTYSSCATTIAAARNWSGGVEIDWRHSVGAIAEGDAFARINVAVLATTTSSSGPTLHRFAAILVDVGTPEMRDRLIRAVTYLTQHCSSQNNLGF